ncbi:MAG: MBL fold metallo-hydrolase [Chitinophagales bacterium]
MKNRIRKSLLVTLGILGIFIVFIVIKFSFIGKDIDIEKCKPFLLQSTNQKNIKLTYLGTSCFIIDNHGKKFMSDPFFSNPSLISTFIGTMKQEPIADYIPTADYANISMTTISHGHYDHCFDVAQIVQPNTTLVADKSTLLQLNNELQSNPNQIALTAQPFKDWVYSKDSAFRVFPILCKHNPHFGKTVLFSGHYSEALASVPTKLWQWKLGESNYSFIIDALQADSVVFRMALLSGNISEREYQKIQTICSTRKCDVLSSTFWKKKINEPSLRQSLASTQADIILLNHWNNFFRSNKKSLQQLRSSKLEKELVEFKKEHLPIQIMLPFTSVTL